MKLKWVRKVFSDGMHNAFTGLAFFKGRYFLAFRRATHHGGSEKLGPSYGHQMLMSSPDGECWALQRETVFPVPAVLPPGEQMDSRDNYFLNLEGELRLYSYAGPPFLPAEDRYMIPHYSTVQVTRDGEIWTEPRAVMDDCILWKPIFWRDKFWCAAYRLHETERYVVELLQSDDGFDWRFVSRIAVGNECFLHPVERGHLRAFVRTQNASGHLEIWDSRAPYTAWRRVAIVPKIIQSPHVIDAQGRRFLLGREVPETGSPAVAAPPGLRRTKIWELHDTEVREVLELPSLGDTSYVGTVVRPDALLLVSYYSQHERELGVPAAERGGNDKPADVFVAGIEI